MTPWTVALQAPLSMGFSRQKYWSGLPFPSPGDLPNPGIKPETPALQADSLLSEPPEKLMQTWVWIPALQFNSWCNIEWVLYTWRLDFLISKLRITEPTAPSCLTVRARLAKLCQLPWSEQVFTACPFLLFSHFRGSWALWAEVMRRRNLSQA